MRLVWLVLLVGCGDSVADPIPDFTPGCERAALDTFTSAAAFPGTVVAGTLADWNPDGRWFMTGSSGAYGTGIHFERRVEGIVVDGHVATPGTLTSDALFQRSDVGTSTYPASYSKRIANLDTDGSLRVDTAYCNLDGCSVCVARLVRAERHDPKESENLTLVGEYRSDSWPRGITVNVRVAGDFAYLVRRSGLHIIDISDLAHPVERGTYASPDAISPNDIKLVEANGRRYAIIADAPVEVVDVTNPDAPMLVAQIPESAHTLFVEGRFAYFANLDATATAYDVSDPAAPLRLGRFDATGSYVHDLSVVDGIAYLNAMEGGFQIVDFTTPASPVLKGTWAPTTTGWSHSNWTTTVGGRKIALHGDESYGAHLDVVDIDPSSSTFMQPIGSYKTHDFVSIHNLMAFGAKGYVTYYQDGVRVLDLADPTKPKLVGYFNTWDPQSALSSSAFYEGAIGIDVDLERKLIFVADTVRGLLILRDDT